MFDKRNGPIFRSAFCLEPQTTCPVQSGDVGYWLDGNPSPAVLKLRNADGTDAEQAAATSEYAPVRLVDTSVLALASYVYDSTALTLTANATNSQSNIDGKAPAKGDRVLRIIGDAQDGIYQYTTAKAVGVKAVWTRVADLSASAAFVNGAIVAAYDGTTYADTLWALTFTAPFTMDTSTMTWTQTATAVTFAAVKTALAAANSSVGVNSQKFTGLAAGSAAGDSLRWEQGGMLVSASNTGTVGAATKYMSPIGGGAVNAAQVALGVVTRAGVLRNLNAALGTAPGGADTVAFTVQKSSDQGATWSDTTLTCTISAAGKSASDTTHTPAVAAGDFLAIKMVSSAGTAAAPAAGFEIL